jgi:hypothetical protein
MSALDRSRKFSFRKDPSKKMTGGPNSEDRRLLKEKFVRFVHSHDDVFARADSKNFS